MAWDYKTNKGYSYAASGTNYQNFPGVTIDGEAIAKDRLVKNA